MSTKVAIVTGSAQGIGRGIALRLAKDGYNLVLNDLSTNENLRALGEEIRKMGRQVVEYLGDASKEDEVRDMVNTAVESFGGVDVMVANAGIFITKPFLECTLEDWDKIFDVNGKSIFLCYKYAAQQMIKQGRGGRIIGACSLGGKQGQALISLYCASKFAVRSLTQSAAAELKQHGITVNAYAPSIIQTPMLDQLKVDLQNYGVDLMRGFDVGVPEDVAGLVSYLVSEDAKFITGQTINLNGGVYFE